MNCLSLKSREWKVQLIQFKRMEVYQNLLGNVLAPCFNHNIWKENLNVQFVECNGQQNKTENNFIPLWCLKYHGIKFA
jgi:hypothetical protein